MDPDVSQIGYPFLVLGTIVEGDATLLTAGFLAHRGYLRLPLVIAVAGLTTAIASYVYFLLARRAGDRVIAFAGGQSERLERVLQWSRRHGVLLVLASRFMIGFRTLAPIAAGIAGMRPMQFFVWNAAGAALWSIVFGLAGYAGGHALSLVLSDIRRHELTFAAALLVICGGIILWRTRGREAFEIWGLYRSLPRQRG